ncbi:hypothetical protein GOODEAATRI_005942 [Goodea atripinnis]|uniref:Uncharacterized protein n=1 Tax=Goodea atripinnis TaxID=208336 RepID=A0ABV0PBQ8_9TELE
MLRDVGAVDFLSQLSPTIEPRLRAVIDGTLDQLFQLPELLPSHSAVYSHRACSTATTGVTNPVSQNSSFSHTQEVRGSQHSQASSPAAECSSRPSVVGRTGQRARGDAHMELLDLSVKDVLELQLQQLSVAQFAVATMQHAIPLLKTGGSLIIYYIPWQLFEYGLCFGIYALVKPGPLRPSAAGENLPERTAAAIFHLCLDSSLGSLLPSMQETAVAYLEQVNSDSHDIYRRVNRAALWMESTCNFVKEAQAEV